MPHGSTPRPLLTVALIVLLIAAFGAYGARPAAASYDPAPRHIVNAGLSKLAPRAGTTERRAWIICRIFGKRRCVAALNVAWCESGLNERSGFTPRYPSMRDEHGIPRQGIWQFGRDERNAYGYGRNAWQQTRGALAYYWISGWNPWQCRPGRWV